jgi:phage-related protein
MKATEMLKFTASKKAVQKPVTWEGSPAETYAEFSVENLPFEQAGWTTELTLTNDEEMQYELNRLV